LRRANVMSSDPSPIRKEPRSPTDLILLPSLLAMTKRVFILGVTGYIGGAVFVRVKKSFPNFTYAALVRSEKNEDAVKGAGVDEIIRGDHSAHDVSNLA
jgi:hypothetical protein